MSFAIIFCSISCRSSSFKRCCKIVVKSSANNLTPFSILSKNMSADGFKYEKGTSSVVYVTAPDEKIAKKLAAGLIDEKLAACVNIIANIHSVYKWEGKLNEDTEHLMIIKTRTSRLEELSKWVQDNHPYSVAEVISVPIEQGNIPYLKWLTDSVPEKSK